MQCNVMGSWLYCAGNWTRTRSHIPAIVSHNAPKPSLSRVQQACHACH